MKEVTDIKLKVPLPKLSLEQKRKKIREWLSIPPGERIPLTEKEFRDQLKVKRQEITHCRRSLILEKKLDQERILRERKVTDIVGNLLTKKQPEEILDELGVNEEGGDEKSQVLNALKRMATSGRNAFAAKVWLQAKGEFVERKDITNKVELSADEYFRIRKEAEQRVRELTGDRDRNTGLLPESTVLPEEIREDTG